MKFKLWCIEHRYTAKKVSQVTGLAYITIVSYWQGARKPSRKTEALFKKVLGIPDGLFDEPTE